MKTAETTEENSGMTKSMVKVYSHGLAVSSMMGTGGVAGSTALESW